MKRVSVWLADDSGASAVMVAVLAVVLIAMAAIIIDGGTLYVGRRATQTAADAAALAGVQDLPASPDAAVASADEYVDANPAGEVATEREFTVSSTYVANDTLRARVAAPAFGLTLAKVIGVDAARVDAQATAIVCSPTAFSKGVMPFGIMSEDSSGTTPFGYEFNETVVLKQGAGSDTQGNFQLVDLPGTSDLKKVISGGGASAYIGEAIDSHPGVDAAVMGALDKVVTADATTFDEVVHLLPDGTVSISDYSCSHIIVCPIVYAPPDCYSWSQLNGKSDLQILAFAFFWVDSASPSGPGGQATITGRFIRPLSPEEVADWGPLDPYGAIAFRLLD